MRKIIISLTCVILLFMFSSCSTDFGLKKDAKLAPARTVYLKNNIHCQQQTRRGNVIYKASYANYTDPGAGHQIIPVNSAVQIETGKYLTITNQADGKQILFEFNSRNMGMSADEYISLITSSTKISLNHFSKTDKKGIRDGKAYKGMTKEGVRTALGYPASHKTPSLDSNIWIYWKNRFATTSVEFDKKGKVKQIR